MVSMHKFKFEITAIGYGSVAVWMGPNWMKALILGYLLSAATELARTAGLT